MRRVIFTIILFLGVIGVYYLLKDRFILTEKGKIKKVITDGVKGIIEKDLGRCMKAVSREYKDEQGYTYERIKETLKEAFAEFDNFKVELRNLKISTPKREGKAVCDIVAIGRRGGETGFLVGSFNESFRITLHFRKEEAEWKLIKGEGFTGNTSP